jgi:membrane-associated phospholipid phosphatase
MRRKWLVVWLALSIPAYGLGADTDIPAATPAKRAEISKEVSPPKPSKMVAVGVAAVLAVAVAMPFDRAVRRDLYPSLNTTPSKNLRKFGDIGQLGGPIIGTGFLIHGLAFHDQKSKDTAILSYESFLVAGGISGVLKAGVGRRRPSQTEDPFSFHPAGHDSSFPSGHTTTAFAAATVFSEQYPHWYVIVPAYAAAGTVGFSRLYANQHWLSDVVAGAFLGTVVSHLLRARLRHSRGKTAWRIEPDISGIKLVRSFGGN